MLQAVREQLNPPLAVYGVLLTMVDPKRSHAQRVVATVRHSLKGKVPVFETQIVQNFAYKEAAEVGRTILEFQSRGQAADNYRQLAREVALAAGDEEITALQPRRGGLFAAIGRFFRGLTGGHASQETGRTLAGAA